ncbi:MAG: DUF308 domain-containing protein [Rubritalea sp.]|uniref:HdeD family acid-resistance protein n=1 Tax=Rubritalea sp. TaxID=2109375 RepID=UPI003242459D
MNKPLVDLLSKGWSLLFLRGLAALIFAILAFTVPGTTIAFLITYWAIYILLDGVFSLAGSLTGGSPAPRWWMSLSGLLSVLAAFFCISNPSIAAATFILILGWMCICKGAVEFIGGLTAKSGWFIIAGILSLFFGAWCLSDPLTVAKIIVKLVAAFSFIAGSVFVVLSLKLRNHSKSLPKTIDV